jgi:peptide/nickel transport system permease protein
MLIYTLRRLIQAIPLMLLISILLYAILDHMPGGPLAPYMMNPHITAADIARLKHNFGLDQPSPIRYLRWLAAYVHGDWGWSTMNSTSVTEAIAERLPATIELMGVSLVVSLIIGLAFGILAAVRPYSLWDYFVTTFAFFGMSMPTFWFAILLQILFSVNGIHFRIPLSDYRIDFNLPSAGRFDTDGGGFVDGLRHLILPTTVLSLIQIATWSRFTRASMQEVLHTDYMRTAAAKGLAFWKIILKHGMKNALMPVVTVVALALPGVVGGAVITEQLFAWPGAGRLFFTALQQQDFSLLMGYLVLISVLVVLFNLLADLTYGWLDPRVKYD